MEGLSNLSPRRLQTLLADCHNVKVKRLFFFFADRHQHAWLKRLNKKAVSFGEGKRMLVETEVLRCDDVCATTAQVASSIKITLTATNKVFLGIEQSS